MSALARSLHRCALLLAVGTILFGCNTAQVDSPSPTVNAVSIAVDATDEQTLVLGDVSDEPAKKIEQYQPMADYLATQLQEVGFKTATVRIAPDMETMANWLASGEVDLYFDSPYPALIVSEKSQAKPILRRWKEGVAEYSSVIFTLSRHDIKSVEALKGRTIAFEEAFSTSGYMLPLSYLSEAGLTLKKQSSITEAVDAEEIGYVFSENEQNSIQWVLSNRVAAAAVSLPDYLEIPEETRNQLTILAETEPLPRHLALVSTTLTEEQQFAIKNTLLSMDDTTSGQSVLATFEETQQFDEFPEGSGLERMQALYDLVTAP